MISAARLSQFHALLKLLLVSDCLLASQLEDRPMPDMIKLAKSKTCFSDKLNGGFLVPHLVTYLVPFSGEITSLISVY